MPRNSLLLHYAGLGVLFQSFTYQLWIFNSLILSKAHVHKCHNIRPVALQYARIAQLLMRLFKDLTPCFYFFTVFHPMLFIA